jgi:hypothetical protein
LPELLVLISSEKLIKFLKAINVSSCQFQAINVKQAIWESEWIGAPIRQQRNIVFMMAAANEDFALTAGGFAPVSLRTMIVVRNTEHVVSSQCVTSQKLWALNDMKIMYYILFQNLYSTKCYWNIVIQQNDGEMGDHAA